MAEFHERVIYYGTRFKLAMDAIHIERQKAMGLKPHPIEESLYEVRRAHSKDIKEMIQSILIKPTTISAVSSLILYIL
jgi:hypothetical protein